ncbi:MAG: hypothetical protein CVV51_02690 [Spirochaetae bacterium HGW-Spirochaetae-7]|nr:MAG: hypothetical protein CVV51_02690 [Spirochaetae bacterium HGW-Spirochaetae-7]
MNLPATPAKLAMFLAILSVVPSNAFCQSAEALAARLAVMKKTTDARFSSIAIDEAGKLASVDDAQWLLGELAGVAGQAGDRKALYVGRASLLELVGKYREAASAWEAAARAIPGVADARCLLSAAACMLAAGESDAASGFAAALSFCSPDAATASLARLISGWAALSFGDAQTARSIASAAMDNPEPRVAVSALLLARAAAEEPDREGYDRLLSKRFPGRPEAGSTVPLALFLMTGSLTAGPMLATAPVGSTNVGDGPVGATFFQVGAFRDEANAQALVARLARLGLEAHAGRKASSGLFVVYVNAGQDAQATVLKLKDAGYESWMMDGIP